MTNQELEDKLEEIKLWLDTNFPSKYTYKSNTKAEREDTPAFPQLHISKDTEEVSFHDGTKWIDMSGGDTSKTVSQVSSQTYGYETYVFKVRRMNWGTLKPFVFHGVLLYDENDEVIDTSSQDITVRMSDGFEPDPAKWRVGGGVNAFFSKNYYAQKDNHSYWTPTLQDTFNTVVLTPYYSMYNVDVFNDYYVYFEIDFPLGQVIKSVSMMPFCGEGYADIFAVPEILVYGSTKQRTLSDAEKIQTYNVHLNSNDYTLLTEDFGVNGYSPNHIGDMSGSDFLAVSDAWLDYYRQPIDGTVVLDATNVALVDGSVEYDVVYDYSPTSKKYVEEALETKSDKGHTHALPAHDHDEDYANLSGNSATNFTAKDMIVAGNIYHHGDTDTYINFDTNYVGIVTGGTRRAYFNANGLYLDGGSSKTSVNEFSTDTTLGGNSNSAVPTEKAVKTYVDSFFNKGKKDVIGVVHSGSTNRNNNVLNDCSSYISSSNKLYIGESTNALYARVNTSYPMAVYGTYNGSAINYIFTSYYGTKVGGNFTTIGVYDLCIHYDSRIYKVWISCNASAGKVNFQITRLT